jgi:hypothetical protein
MPGKSRHGKGKHPHHSKKSKAIQRRQAGILQPQPDSVTAMPTAAVQAPVPTATATPKARTAQYPYITSELRRIGILAGIILVILIVLSVVL